MIQQKNYFNLKEVADYLSLSKRSIYSLVAKRKIPFIFLSSRALRFSRHSVDKWMAQKEIKTVRDYL